MLKTQSGINTNSIDLQQYHDGNYDSTNDSTTFYMKSEKSQSVKRIDKESVKKNKKKLKN